MAFATRRFLRHGLTGLSLGLASALAQAPGDLRVALVIGNAAYPGTAALANPLNDAQAMGATLRTLGFRVHELKNGSRQQMVEAIDAVRGLLQGKQGIGVLYYAGHGVQMNLRNYMIPVNAALAAEADLPRHTVDVGDVIDAFRRAGNRMNIVVLDACRDNPFADGSPNKGLAPLDAPSGTFLAYATAPGNVAEDGEDGGNGLYTGYLVKELQKPATRIEDVFKRVRLQVRQRTAGRQIPWESTSLEEDFFFNDGAKYTFRSEDLQRLADAARRREEQLQQQAALALAQQQRLAEELQAQRLREEQAAREAEAQRLAHEARVREAERLQAQARAREQARLAEEARVREEQRQAEAAQARERERQLAMAQQQERERAAAAALALEQARKAEEARLQEVAQAQAQALERERLARLKVEEAAALALRAETADWDKIKESQNAADFFEFLQKYPNGFISEQAQFRLDRLARTTITTQVRPGRVAPPISGTTRYRIGDVFVYSNADFYGKDLPARRLEITNIAYDTIYVNRGRETWDLMGNLISNGAGVRNPSRVTFPADLALGKRWQTAYTITLRNNAGTDTLAYDYRVVAYEDVVVPAGSFKAFRIEGRTRRSDGMLNTHTYWVDAASFMLIKDHWDQRIYNNVGRQVNEGYRRELVEFSRGKTLE